MSPETERHLDSFLSLARLAHTVTASLALPEVLDRVVGAALDLIPGSVARIWVLDEDRLVLRSEAGTHDPLQAGPRTTLATGEGLVGRVAATREQIVVADILADSRFVNREWLRREQVVSAVFLPLLVRDRLVGVLSLFARRRHQFTKEEVELLEAFGAQAAIAIENARLYTEAQARVTRMTQLTELSRLTASTLQPTQVFTFVTEAALGLLQCDLARLWVVDQAGLLRLQAMKSRDGEEPPIPPSTRLPLGQSLVGWVVDRRTSRYSPNLLDDPLQANKDWVRAGGYVSQLAVPLIVGERAVGALLVLTKSPRRFSPEDVELLELFGRQAGLALENARLYKSQEVRAHRLSTLAQLNELVSSSLNTQTVLTMIAKAAGELMQVPVVSCWVADELTRTLTVRAFSAPEIGADFPLGALPFALGGVGWVAAHRAPLEVDDVFADERFHAVEWCRRHGLRSFYAVPLTRDGALLGVLALNGRTPFRLGTEDQNLLQAFVAHATVGIANARMYQRLRDSEASFRLLFANNPHPMWVYDLEGLAFLEVNEAAVRHYGYSRDEFLGMRITDIRPSEDAARIAGHARARPELQHSGVWRHRRKDGRIINVEVVSHTLEFANRQAALVVAQDITERQRLEGELVQARKLEAIGKLAGGVAHDFNNLLTVITGRTQILLEQLGSEEPRRRPVELIQKAAERATSLTRQLLAFSRKQLLRPKVLDVNVVVAGLDPILRRLLGEHIGLVTVLDPTLGRVKVDPGQLEQVLLNLCVNARDAMPEGGPLTIETANVDLNEAYAQIHPGVSPGAHVMLAVSDRGVGMDQETLGHIFEPFFTTKEVGQGTGLGLATVYGIVQQSGGHISVTSEPGQGTTFKIYLPRSVDVMKVGLEASAGGVLGGSETILVVDDQPEVLGVVREMLEMVGYRVLDAASPGDALLAAVQHEGPIHLLVTDVVMPQMNGCQLAQRLALRRPEMKVLYMSGYTDDAIVHHGVLDPGTAFLPKPFSPDVLARKVRQVLDPLTPG